MNKTIFGITFVILVTGLVFEIQSSPAYGTVQYLQMPIRVQHGPTICAIEPKPNPKFPVVGKQLLDETEYSVIDWKTKLNQGLGKHPVWNINLIRVPVEQQKGFEYSQCDITIHYFPEPQRNSDKFIAGVTIPDFETGKTNIEIYYLDIQPNWVKKEWTENNQEYYTYVDKPYYTGLVATSTQLDSTIRHEIGHSFGLGHYIVPYDRLRNIINGLEDMPSIMIDTITVLGVKHYDITSLDITQIKSIYGDGGFDNQVQQKFGYQRVHQLSTDKQSYQPDQRIILNINTDLFGVKSFAEILVIDSNNTMMENFGVSKSNSIVQLSNIYQKNGKYLAEIINPITGSFDFTDFTIGVQNLQAPIISQESHHAIKIPTWVKSNARWWSQGLIGDNEFTKGLEYLAMQGIVKIPHVQSSTSHSGQIPNWVKNSAGQWSSGKISDDEFVTGLQYLVNNGIIQIQ
jgi:hypothetical protein